MIEEIEIYLNGPGAIWHGRGREPARRHVQGHLPPVVDHGSQRKPDFSDDLCPQMQCGVGITPAI